MDSNQFNWVSGLDKSGIIALILFAVFFIIALITIIMMLKINAENKRRRKEHLLEDEQKPTTISNRSKPPETESEKPENKNDNSDPLEQAGIYLTYGLNKQAIDLLEKYLEKNPSDNTASEMLAKARQ